MRILLLLLCLASATSGWSQFKKIEMSPPSTKKLQDRRLSRYNPILLNKMKGYIGETESGFLAIVDLKLIPVKEQESIKKLVAEENKDRETWYKEIIAYNKLSVKEKEFLIKSAYGSFKGIDAKGTYHYEGKKWQKKY